MARILLYGLIAENNFGCPSLMHGIKDLISDIHKDGEIICYQQTAPAPGVHEEMGFQVLKIPYGNPKRLLLDALKTRAGFALKDAPQRTFFEDIKASDSVINLFGICFCDNFSKRRIRLLNAVKSVFGQFAISIIAKWFGVKTIKGTASYGPMETKGNQMMARLAVGYVFDRMYAREEESRRQMQEVAGIRRNIPVTPDLANYWIIRRPEKDTTPCIGISVSYQIIRQWESKEGYLDCMVALIQHINQSTAAKIILIPNELLINGEYDDQRVAEEIYEMFQGSGLPGEVTVCDAKNMSSVQLKTLISGCEAMVASRYHACVAALSCGVPTLVIGWHYKYDELLKWYGQEKWILSSKACTTEKLIGMFDEFWGNREREGRVIQERYAHVRRALFKAGEDMFLRREKKV